jgi:hypothetical protein
MESTAATRSKRSHLVSRVAGTYKSESRFHNVRTLFTHASAVINDQPDSGGDIFGAKHLDVLDTAFFIDLKIGRFQSGYLPSPAVGNRDVEDDQIDIDSDYKLPSVPVLLNRDGGS